MVGGDEALLRQEVVELTSFVQRDPAWADLRAAIVVPGGSHCAENGHGSALVTVFARS
jgi:hypothetical protein